MTKKKEFKLDKPCWLYWIHRKSHTDIFTQGYVGITTNLTSRFTVHKSNLRNTDYRSYRTDFRNAMKEDDLVFDVILQSDQSYCMSIERKLRPDWCVGWNIAVGGSGGTGTHGLSKTRPYKAYHAMKKMAEGVGYCLSEDWLGDYGLLSFIEFYNRNKIDNKKIIRITGNPVFEDTVVFTTHSAVTTLAHAKYSIDDSGTKYSINELAEIFNMRPNTISTRISRGKTVREAVGLDKFIKRVVIIEGVEYEYCGKLSDEDFKRVKILFQEGSSLTSIGETVGMDSSSLSRLVRKYGFERLYD